MSDPVNPELRLANDNPWYCLATLYGEQAEESSLRAYDKDLAAKNRMAWNRWMAAASNEARIHRLLDKDASVRRAVDHQYCRILLSVQTGRGGYGPAITSFSRFASADANVP